MRSKVRHPVFARLYGRFSPMGERTGVGEHRDEMLAGLSGDVVEVGAGNGLNFAHYPAGVRHVTAFEPEPYLRQLALQAAAASPVPVDVLEGTADRIPSGDGVFDAAVSSLVLCSVADVGAALAELHRVLRSGGELRFYEHVRAADPGRARLQDRIDPIWSRMFGGCHPNRDTEASIVAAVFHSAGLPLT
jgi:SAM-dependent methyltransferase